MVTGRKLSKATRAQGAVLGYPRLLGERLCLDFVNTLEKEVPPDPVEYLGTYADLARWGRHVRVLTEDEVARALERGIAHPEAALVVHARAIAFRRTLTRLFTAIAHGEDPESCDLRALEDAAVGAAPSLRLRREADQYDWIWTDADRQVERLLWEIARSALHVLRHDDLARLKECPGAGDCGSLFLDTSRNGTRRWCSMEGCGSRIKMRRHYARHRDSSSP